MGYKYKDEHVLFQGFIILTHSIDHHFILYNYDNQMFHKSHNTIKYNKYFYEEKPKVHCEENIGEQHHRWYSHHRDVLQWDQLLRQGSSLARRWVCVQCDAGRHLLLCQCGPSVPVIQQRKLEELGV